MLITEEQCLMFRDIVQWGINELHVRKVSTVQEGVLDEDGDYSTLMKFMRRENELNIYASLYIDKDNRTDYLVKFYCDIDVVPVNMNMYSTIHPDNTFTDITRNYDFCTDFESSMFQLDISRGTETDDVLNMLVLGNFIRDLMVPNLRIVFDMSKFMVGYNFSTDKLRKFHNLYCQ